MRALWLPLLLLTGCHGPAPLSPELRAEFNERRARVIDCLESRDAFSASRRSAPELRIEDTCWFYKRSLGMWIKGYTDHHDYVQIGSDRAALEHELAAYHSGTHVHCSKDDPDCEALTNACGDRLSRQWRRENGFLPCVDNRPESEKKRLDEPTGTSDAGCIPDTLP